MRNREFILALLVFGQCPVAMSQSPTAATNEVIPIERFTKYDEIRNIKLSPTGEYVAYMTGKYGRSIVAISSMKEKKMTAGAKCPDGFEIYDFHWISETRVVYELAERQEGSIKPSPTGQMSAINVDGKQHKLIYGYNAGEEQTGTFLKTRKSSYASPEIIRPLLADRKTMLIAEHPWKSGASYWYYDRDAKPIITRLDTFTGDKKTFGSAPLSNASLLADNDEQVRFAIGRNEQFKLSVSWKPDPKGPWTAFDLSEFEEESIIPIVLSEDNQSAFFIGTRTDESLTALFSIDFKTKAVTKVYGFERSDVTDVILDFTQKRIVGVVSYLDKSLVHWLNPDDRAAKIYQSLTRAFPGQSIHIESATSDGRLAIIEVRSDVRPGDYYLFDTQTMKANYWLSAQRWIDPATMRSKEPFTLKARDGLELHGYITQPAGTGPFPMVVLPHGGPHGVRDYWDYEWDVQLLANRGYAVLQVNFRGSGGFGQEFESKGYGNWGGTMQDDVTDATRWAIDKKIAAADRICIFGASYGGYAALQGVVREPTLYRCAIGYAGVYDQELMLSSADIPRSKSGRAYLQSALGTDRERMHQYSPVYNADKIQVPVLLIHGKEDFRADFEHAKRMKAALEKNNKPMEWMALSREGHGVYDEESRREVYERVLAFLDRNLKSGTKQAAKAN